MRLKMASLAAVCAALLTLASCLGSNDEVNYVYYDDTAITEFSLGSLNVYVHTKSSTGSDSVYVTTVSGSNYDFYIDQSKNEIYNVDSLPYGTDAAHVLATISSKNSGLIYLKSLKSDSLSYYSSTDSIDFSQPRTIEVVSQSAAYYRKYTVKVNVHQQKEDDFAWSRMAVQQDFAGMSGIKAVAKGDSLFVFGTDGNTTTAFVTARADGQHFAKLPVSFTAGAYANAIAGHGKLYMLDGGVLKSSADGATWTTVTTNAALTHLVGYGTKEMYALSEAGRIMSSADGGVTWKADELDDNTSLLPTANLNFALLPLKTNDEMERVLLTGTRTGSANALVWSKIVDYSATATAYPWTFVDAAEDNRYSLQALSNLQVMCYGNQLVAFGTDNGTLPAAMSVSLDQGITWRTDSVYALPAQAQSGIRVLSATADADNFVWVVCTGTGEVWRGRLSQLGWKKENDSFLK